jgi:hypothetical protein
MTRILIALLVLGLFLVGCINIRTEECVAPKEASPATTQPDEPQPKKPRPPVPPQQDYMVEVAAQPQIPPFRRIEPRGFADSGRTTLAEIEAVAAVQTNVRLFVAWLESHSNVSDVGYRKLTWLASNPPQQIVTFKLDDTKHRLTLPADVPIFATRLHRLSR